MTWDELGLSFGTDKASSHHGYLDVMEDQLCQRPVSRLLEIGVAGGRSLALWRAVFPDAFIVGVDNNPACLLHQRERSAVVLADAANPAQMAAVSTLYGPFDVAIDDGSHNHDDVRMCFEEIYPRLANGGIYIVEDLDGDDPFVVDFVSRHHGCFWSIPDRIGYAKMPGLILIPASW